MPQANSSRKLMIGLAIFGAGCFLLMILASVALVTLFVGFTGGMGSLEAGLDPGDPAPAIVARGWLNGDEPAPDAFEGKVVVVEAWASW